MIRNSTFSSSIGNVVLYLNSPSWKLLVSL
jgi:hypothetical protein